MVKRIISAFFGFLLGITTFVAVAGGFVMLTTPETEAQVAGQNCFKKGECLEGETTTKCGPEGCCSGTRCFLPDASCNSTGNTTDNGRCYVKSQPTKLTFAIGNKQTVLDLGDYIAAVYTYAVSVAGIFAIIMMMIGGFQWMTARDNPQIAQDAKERISNALIGLAITLFAFLVLNTVNPDIVLLRLPKIEVIKRSEFAVVACENTGLCVPCGQQYGIKLIRGANETRGGQPPTSCNQSLGIDQPGMTSNLEDPDIIALCVGTGCKKKDGSCSDANHRCLPADPGGSTTFCQENVTTNPTVSASTTLSGGAISYVCKACNGIGTECSVDGRDSSCCSGFCSDGFCGTGENGEQCNNDATCKSKNCAGEEGLPFVGTLGGATTLTSGYCSNGKIGAYCGGNTDCREDGPIPLLCLTQSYFKNARCIPADLDSAAGHNATVLAVLGIARNYFGVIQLLEEEASKTSITYAKNLRDKDGDYGTICFRNIQLGIDTCAPPSPEGLSQGEIVKCLPSTNVKISVDEGEFSGQEVDIGICTSNSAGAACSSNDDCASKLCSKRDPAFGLGMCIGGNDGDYCEDDDECTSSKCAPTNTGALTTDYKACTSGKIGSHCSTQSHCDPGLSCQSNRCLE